MQSQSGCTYFKDIGVPFIILSDIHTQAIKQRLQPALIELA